MPVLKYLWYPNMKEAETYVFKLHMGDDTMI